MEFAISGGFTYLIVERYVTMALLLIVLSVAGMLTRQAPPRVQWRAGGDSPLLFLAFGIVLFVTLTAETSSFFHDYLPRPGSPPSSVLVDVVLRRS